MNLSVIIVTYRSAAYIDRCLAAVERAVKAVDAEVIVVDNNSPDDTVAVARAAAPWVRVLARDVNGGFAEGCVAGAEVAAGDRLVFVNPDAEVRPETFAELLDCAGRHPRAGIVGGRCLTETGENDPRSWWGRPTPWSVFCFATGLSTVFPGRALFDPESPATWTGERRVPIVTGALMLVGRDVWDEVGGFDTRIFMYGEDADLCLRARAAGYRPMVTDRAVFVHPGGMSSSSLGKLVLLFTGKATVVRRHLPRGTRAAGAAMLLFGVWLRAALSRRVAPPDAGRQGRPIARRGDWAELWAVRADWRGGWDARTP
ncbi:glycosyltransferase family 2 protein [Sphaerisporangium corydalis]|uniref:Glycosyltransferase family 2 protein n=1 Tax=Sphaerisporangium corydalis TaxID=1441875 RepID=A0ABV9EH55_9ACTN|nr:glycosyltransferase family 2 protein [Sphaerisporangium corydalis]